MAPTTAEKAASPAPEKAASPAATGEPSSPTRPPVEPLKSIQALHVDQVEVDDQDDDRDSTLSLGSTDSSTTSISSSVTNYRFENGRRYHGFRDGAYVMPNDEQEQERLDIVHHEMLIALDSRLHLCNFSSPPQKILDLGTGTGIWALDMADEYPSAEVIGIDLSPIQPHWVAPNCHFQVDDFESEWTFADNSFDLIHMRHLGFSVKDWPRLFRQAYAATKKGGWVNITDYDPKLYCDDRSLPPHSNTKVMMDACVDGLRTIGCDPDFVPKMKGWLEEAGFVEIEEITLKYPWGLWPRDKRLKEIGRWWLLGMENGAFEAHLTAMFTRALGWSLEKTNTIIQNAKKEIRTGKLHVYNSGNYLVARKR